MNQSHIRSYVVFHFFSHMKFDRYNNGKIRVHAGSSLKKFIKLLNLLGEKSSNY